jgi:hypothetical protein
MVSVSRLPPRGSTNRGLYLTVSVSRHIKSCIGCVLAYVSYVTFISYYTYTYIRTYTHTYMYAAGYQVELDPSRFRFIACLNEVRTPVLVLIIVSELTSCRLVCEFISDPA